MVNIIFILLGIVFLIAIWVIIVYNRLIKVRVLMREAWSIIDIFLKKRHDLIPNLVETVKGYAAHEKETMENITIARSKAMGANGFTDRIASENMLGNQLGRLMVAVEKYPDLKANETFLHLQKELVQLENEIERARRYYNGTVRNNNIAIEVFPANIVAGMFRFANGDFFESTGDDRVVPQIVIND